MIGKLTRIPVLAAALSFLATACDEAPSTREVYMATRGTVDFLRHAASRTPGLPVFVDRDPFGDPDARSEVFAEAMRAATRRYNGIHFSAAGQSEGVTVDRVIVVFDVPKGTTGLTICKGETVDGPVGGDPLNFRAVMCRGAERLAEAEGRLPHRPGNANDKALARLFQDAAKILVQEEDKTPK